MIAWSPKNGASATQLRSPTPKAPPKANVTNPVEDSPTRSCVPARKPFRIVGAGRAKPYSSLGGAAHWTEVFGGRCHLLLQSTSQGASLWARRRQPRDKAEAVRSAGASSKEIIAQSINSEGSHWSGSKPRVSSILRLKFRRASSAASKSSPVTAASFTNAERSVGWHMFVVVVGAFSR